MILEMLSRKVNGAADLTGTVRVLSDDGELLFEDVVNLSKAKSREAFINEVADRAKQPRDKVRTAVLKLMENLRQVHLKEATPVPGAQKESKPEKLVREFLKVGAELFHDQLEHPYVAMIEDGRRAIFRLRSLAFRDRLSHLSFTKFGEVPSNDTLNGVIGTLSGLAKYQGPEHKLHVRTAWHQGALYYDLGDYRAVRIDGSGWEIQELPPILFKRYGTQRPQVEPELGGQLTDVLPLINIQDEHLKLLYVTDLVASLVPGIPRPISIFHGPQGSAKTYALRIKRELMDPSNPLLTTQPKDVDSFVQTGSHNMCLFIDNVTYLPGWMADGFSRYCTGDGYIKRALFTDDDDFVFNAQGVGGMTGINLVVTQPDLLDRSFIFPMRRVPDGDRMQERDLDERFTELRPKLVGAMFTALSGAMVARDYISAVRLPRLADYSVWACAVASTLGFDEEYYWSAVGMNRDAQNIEALEASLVALAVRALMEDRIEWRGKPGELLKDLDDLAEGLKINTKAKAWPKDPAWMTRRLNPVVPNLAQVGIRVESGHVGDDRWIEITRV